MKFKVFSTVAIISGISLISTSVLSASGSSQDQELLEQAKMIFQPLPSQIAAPASNPTTPEKVALGKKLFFEPRLSLSGVISCNTCHNLSTYGSDNLSSSLGHKFQTGGRNSPTVLNAGLHFTQFWDGRAKDLEEQAKGPILNPLEMAMPDQNFTIERIRNIPEYSNEFKKVFKSEKQPVNYENVSKAIAAFERTLVTPSKFDKFLKGDTKALNDKEKNGLRTFVSKGCITCHNGVAVGGKMFQKFGLVNPYPYQKDLGRFEVTKNETDKYIFKVPSLRNITRTYPYFHDGKVWDINEAVKIMGKTQLGMDLSKNEVSSIVSFLDSLTGEIPKDALMLPVLPPSNPNVSKPRI